ncbi:energy transducer TonB [Altericroceibacterium endophyticum]|uniref:TonB family protein n=1 Tax=Altericroceibacterium endophyticum TaxID=1808508 RepID=A0A6I4T1J9_9SPHN|nr:energy transducer TonB [Altericroceibacterium endophyticum]MXO64222.1 TonB family protein [Altericroceibacterium endophyticum]
MTYAEQKVNNSRRFTALVAVGGIHAVIGYALVTGLAADMVDKVMPRIEATIMPLDPPPPPEIVPEPAPANEAAANPPMAPSPAFPLTPPQPDLTLEPFEPLTDIGPVVPKVLPPAVPSPSPSVTPAATPEAASPRNNPGSWATPNDYPSRALREGQEGVASFRVVVGSDGKVRSCEITASSGHALLDKATCDNVTRRARFNPAKNDSGAKVVGTYSSRIRWTIPD